MGIRAKGKKKTIRAGMVNINLWVDKEWDDKMMKYVDPYAKYGEAAVYRRAIAEWLIAKGDLEPPKPKV
jgi:hypothetical protein